MATVRFYLQSKKNPANIYVSLSVSRGNVFKRKTNYVINPKKWSTETDYPKQNDEELKNLKTDLIDLANNIEKRLNIATNNKVDINGGWLKEQIDALQGKVKQKDAVRLINSIQAYIDYLPRKKLRNEKRGATLSTIARYKTVKNKINEFEQYRGRKILVKNVGTKFIEEFEQYLIDVDKLNINTIGRYIKFVKTVCMFASNTNNIATNPTLNQIKGYSEKAHKVFLTPNELATIENTTFKRTALENAKDWLIIGCYIGQRVSDLLILADGNITTRNGLKLIELTQKKTGKLVSIPLHPKVSEILEKRNGNFPEKISAQKFNKHLKDLCKLAEINEPTEGAKFDKTTKRKVKGTYPKYELITSHVCRRSFASNFYGEIPTPLLMGITAHSTESQFLEYIGKTSTDYAIQIAEYWSKESLQAKKEPQMTVLKQAN